MFRVPPLLTGRARRLRRDATEAERVLWRHLRLWRPRFTRQLVVGPSILDFACRVARIAVEVDGETHVEEAMRDAARTARLGESGWEIVRFWNNEVLGNTDGVLQVIVGHVERRTGAAVTFVETRGGP